MSGKRVEIRLVAGLGNPGNQYEQTRHNAGFWLVEEIARHHGAHFRLETKFSGEVCKLSAAGKDVWLLKPDTFMNRSGLAVRKLAEFYKIPLEQILVVHDELDLDAGIARLKSGGGHGGHNGLRDIIQQMGGNTFQRLRIGVGHPGQKDKVVDFVLHRPSAEEHTAIRSAMDKVMHVWPLLLEGEWDKAVHRLHS